MIANRSLAPRRRAFLIANRSLAPRRRACMRVNRPLQQSRRLRMGGASTRMDVERCAAPVACGHLGRPTAASTGGMRSFGTFDRRQHRWHAVIWDVQPPPAPVACGHLGRPIVASTGGLCVSGTSNHQRPPRSPAGVDVQRPPGTGLAGSSSVTAGRESGRPAPLCTAEPRCAPPGVVPPVGRRGSLRNPLLPARGSPGSLHSASG